MPRREQLEKMLESDQDDVFLNYALAMALLSDGDSRAGIERLQRVIELDPNYVPAYFQQGQALAREGQIDEARGIVSRGIETAKRVGDTHAETEMTGFLESL